MTLNELKLKLRGAGVAGAGGAGFPAYAKLSDAADTIILNCAECEPLLKLHRQVLAEYAYEIMSALQTVKEATGADNVIIALKKNYKDAINAVNSVLDKFNNFSISYKSGVLDLPVMLTLIIIEKSAMLPLYLSLFFLYSFIFVQ